MNLALVGRDPQRLEELAKSVGGCAVRAKTYRADLNCDEDISHLMAEVGKDFESVDVLIHSAGLFRMGAVADSQVADLDALYRTNVRAPYSLTKALLPMIIASRGQIVFVNSSAGLTARSSIAAYAGTKHALKAIADSLRCEVNSAGVRVISVYPGRTATPLQADIHQQEGKRYEPHCLLQPEDIAKTILSALSMPRTAEVTDVSIRPMQKS